MRILVFISENLNVDYNAFSIATPLPETELYKIAKEGNLLPPGFDFSEKNFKGFGQANITTEEFTPEELQIVRAFEWDRINFKTGEKAKKIAEMGGLTIEELNQWRVSTRRGTGINVEYKE